ncbi:MAG: hypothetical protein KatS3mg097_244 [Candidatus Parcubacteria bacterium]|nr:MAG: hypothetical protein KatS3mg097_244 [Candidatus Parcubacteria bacterium]
MDIRKVNKIFIWLISVSFFLYFIFASYSFNREPPLETTPANVEQFDFTKFYIPKSESLPQPLLEMLRTSSVTTSDIY